MNLRLVYYRMSHPGFWLYESRRGGDGGDVPGDLQASVWVTSHRCSVQNFPHYRTKNSRWAHGRRSQRKISGSMLSSSHGEKSVRLNSLLNTKTLFSFAQNWDSGKFPGKCVIKYNQKIFCLSFFLHFMVSLMIYSFTVKAVCFFFSFLYKIVLKLQICNQITILYLCDHFSQTIKL